MIGAPARPEARIAGLVAGILLVAVVAWTAFRVPVSAARLGLGVSLRVVPSGELSVDPEGADVLRASGLEPGERAAAARGLLHVRNQTAQTVAARPRLQGGDPALDDVLHLELTRRGRTVYRGPVGPLRTGSARAAVLVRSGELAGLRVRAFVPAGVPERALGADAKLTLAFVSEPVR